MRMSVHVIVRNISLPRLSAPKCDCALIAFLFATCRLRALQDAQMPIAYRLVSADGYSYRDKRDVYPAAWAQRG
jgi:hypothetical protein